MTIGKNDANIITKVDMMQADVYHFTEMIRDGKG